MENVRKEFDIDILHDRGIKGNNVTVAVLDTGINIKHPDLVDSCSVYYDVLYNRRKAYDDNGHGTHIAGIIAGRGRVLDGRYRGIAPESKIVAIKVLNASGKGSISMLQKGTDWILKNADKYNIRIVNMSVGATNTDETEDYRLVKSVEELWDAGIVVVAAAGNNGPEKNTISSPGISRKIITVGAYDDDKEVHLTGNRKMVNYSGRGPTKECVIKPEILAPGYEIVSCCSSGKLYELKSGTSMATPIVAGMCALLIGVHPKVTPREVKKIIHDTAIDLGLQKNKQGWGKINLQKYLLRD